MLPLGEAELELDTALGITHLRFPPLWHGAAVLGQTATWSEDKQNTDMCSATLR